MQLREVGRLAALADDDEIAILLVFLQGLDEIAVAQMRLYLPNARCEQIRLCLVQDQATAPMRDTRPNGVELGEFLKQCFARIDDHAAAVISRRARHVATTEHVQELDGRIRALARPGRVIDHALRVDRAIERSKQLCHDVTFPIAIWRIGRANRHFFSFFRRD